MGAVVLDMSMSLDGFVTGPDPQEGQPLGEGGQRLHDWMFSTPADPGGPPGHGQTADVNVAVARDLFATTGAVLMGRTMFDLGIGPWATRPSRCPASCSPTSRTRTSSWPAARSPSSPPA